MKMEVIALEQNRTEPNQTEPKYKTHYYIMAYLCILLIIVSPNISVSFDLLFILQHEHIFLHKRTIKSWIHIII